LEGFQIFTRLQNQFILSSTCGTLLALTFVLITSCSSEGKAKHRQVISIAAGVSHTCALISDGTIKCWGGNWKGQLGNGSTIGSPSPVTVEGISDGRAIAAGSGETCASLSSGDVKCWGDNHFGQLGNKTEVGYSTTPLLVSGISDVISLAIGSQFVCALVSNQSINCWGRNIKGQIANRTGASSLIPKQVEAVLHASSITAGLDFACAALLDGAVQCWGDNQFGQIGDGTKKIGYKGPTSVIGVSKAAAVAAGYDHSCALLLVGEVYCWGTNRLGQLGDGTVTWSTTPVQVIGISTAIAIAAGQNLSCALLSNGTVSCWGLHDMIMDFANYFTTPKMVEGVYDAIAITAGGRHACALFSDSRVKCWGSDMHGELGNGRKGQYSAKPVVVKGLLD